MDILFNKEGTPLMLTSTSVFGESVGRPSDYEVKKRDILSPYDISLTETTVYKDYRVMNWGKGNDLDRKSVV